MSGEKDKWLLKHGQGIYHVCYNMAVCVMLIKSEQFVLMLIKSESEIKILVKLGSFKSLVFKYN